MEKNKKIKDLQKNYRPDEKFMLYGPKALTDAELLAIILRTGSCDEHSVGLSERVLGVNNTRDISIINIFDYKLNELMKIKGIGKVKALQIKSLAELSVRISQSTAKRSLNFCDPKTIADYYMERMRHNIREVVVLLMLNTACEYIADVVLFEGTVNSAMFSPREIFMEALKNDAVNIILLHNHPSGNPDPSKEDILGTKRVYEAGRLVGITLLDHIIVGDRTYFSMKEEGLFDV